jgi:hypothetical protein
MSILILHNINDLKIIKINKTKYLSILNQPTYICIIKTNYYVKGTRRKAKVA